MKKFCALFLLSAYLLSATDLKELLKVNVVVEHLHEHQKKDKSVSLLDFLVMHYVTDDGNNDDDSRDDSLPFKSNDSHAAASFVFIPSKNIQYNFQSFWHPEKDFLFVKTFFVLTDFYASIWHPPQLS